MIIFFFFFFSSRRRHTRFKCDWSSDVCSSDLDHVAAGLLMLLLGVLLFIPGWFGGGDAKLMAAIGLWIGADNLAAYMLWVALAGGVIAVAFFSARSVPL